jgi:hypothetical protein
MTVVFERDLNLYNVDREVYSILDLCSDIGGLFESLRLFFYLVIGLTNFLEFENYMVSALYKKRTGLNHLPNTDRNSIGSRFSMPRGS